MALIEAVIPKADDKVKLILELHKFYGKRISEILCQKVSLIDFKTNRIEWHMKRGKVSFKDIPPYLRKLLREYIQNHDLLGGDDLFYHCNHGGKMIEKSKYNRFIRDLERIAKNKDCPEALELKRTHETRRGVATFICIEDGVEFANSWLDQVRIETTMKYKGRLAKEASDQKAFETMVRSNTREKSN
jgi:integrase